MTLGFWGVCFEQGKTIFIISFGIGIIMICRCIRFARMRYVNIMRLFLLYMRKIDEWRSVSDNE